MRFKLCEIRGCGGPTEFQLLRPESRSKTDDWITVCRKCMEELVATAGFVYVGPRLEKEAL